MFLEVWVFNATGNDKDTIRLTPCSSDSTVNSEHCIPLSKTSMQYKQVLFHFLKLTDINTLKTTESFAISLSSIV